MACVYSPVPENGTGKFKLNGNLYGTGRSVHRPFNSRSIPGFFIRAPVVRIERGNFFLTPTVYVVHPVVSGKSIVGGEVEARLEGVVLWGEGVDLQGEGVVLPGEGLDLPVVGVVLAVEGVVLAVEGVVKEHLVN